MSLEKFSWADVESVEPAPLKPTETHWRPRTRQDCETAPRPCPYVGCRYHLAVNVKGESITHSGEKAAGRTLGGRIKRGMNVERWHKKVLKVIDDLPQTCALDVAAEGAITLEEIGGLLGVSRERARQIEESALMKLRKHASVGDMGELLDALASAPAGETPLAQAQGQALIKAGDVAAMREAG